MGLSFDQPEECMESIPEATILLDVIRYLVRPSLRDHQI